MATWGQRGGGEVGQRLPNEGQGGTVLTPDRTAAGNTRHGGSTAAWRQGDGAQRPNDGQWAGRRRREARWRQGMVRLRRPSARCSFPGSGGAVEVCAEASLISRCSQHQQKKHHLETERAQPL